MADLGIALPEGALAPISRADQLAYTGTLMATRRGHLVAQSINYTLTTLYHLAQECRARWWPEAILLFYSTLERPASGWPLRVEPRQAIDR